MNNEQNNNSQINEKKNDELRQKRKKIKIMQ